VRCSARPAGTRRTRSNGRAALRCTKARWWGVLLLKFEQIEPLGAWFAERLAELMKEQGSALAGGRGGPGAAAPPAGARARVQPGGAALQAAGEAAAITA